MPPKAAPKPAAKKAAAAPAKAAAAKPAAKAAAKPAAKQAAAPAKAAAKPTAKTVSSGNGVYVKGLGNADVDAVKALFASAGAVSQVRLRRNKFALVFFESAASVKKAVDALNNKTVQGETVTVSAAKTSPKAASTEGSKTVFASPLFRTNTTRNQMRALFEGCGKITKLRTYRTNYALVTFDSAAAASKAVSSKNGQTFHNKTLSVKLSAQ